jgi:hypothetical protein
VNRRFTLTSALAIVVQLVPVIANACPYCAGRAGSHPWATAALIGSLISMPYIIGVVVLRAVRRLDDDEGNL